MTKVLVRVDSGKHIGTGHLFRCRSLALSLRARGCSVHFLTRPHDGNFIDLIKDDFSVHVLPPPTINSYLGVPYDDEIRDTQQFMKRVGNFSLAIIDHYFLDSDYEKSLPINNIVVIDDLKNRRHFCNFLIDQNSPQSLAQYRSLNERSECIYFLGPKYALLGDNFKKARPVLFEKKDDFSKVLVTFGGSDLTNETMKVIKAYLEYQGTLEIKVVIKSTHPDYKKIKQLSNGKKPFEVVDFIDDMARAIKESDICFGAGGTSSWERACLGAPCFTVLVADNQDCIIQTLDKEKSLLFVGDGRKTTKKDWFKVFEKLDSTEEINNVASNSFKLCDGIGVERVSSEILDAIL
ncbi:MAG: UDP-2,4-diacetamido-2,4,6-trideoxy-beta-L-altropyranose hydrolase [Bacteriovoracaceae bacterium]|nr:UDP-2,4-diacetamido-2,4,6-trideoxy-beta-L-altropyranose hydrolase [Bacteriovoracaceae bacterium]